MKAPKRNGRAKRLRPGDPAKWGKLDDQLEAKLVTHIKEGLSYQTCCDLVGLPRATFYNWIARGESEPQRRHGEFAKAVARAQAEAVRRLHIRVAITDPKWLLERRHPDLYGAPKMRVETELSGSLETKSELKHKITFSCTDEEGLMDLFKSIPLVDSTGQLITGKERDDILNGRNGSSGGNGKAVEINNETQF
jgi:hypothetical protein